MPAKRSGLKNKVRAFLDQKVRLLRRSVSAVLAHTIAAPPRRSISTAQTQARVARSGHDIPNIHSYTTTGQKLATYIISKLTCLLKALSFATPCSMPHTRPRIYKLDQKERGGRALALLKSNIRQSSDLNNASNEMQAASNEDVDVLLSRRTQLPHDVHGVLDRREDMDVLLREGRDEGRPCVGELVLRLQVRKVGLRDSQGRQV